MSKLCFSAKTFWFDAVNAAGQKVEVREGRFDVHYPFNLLPRDETNTEFINRMNYVFSPLEKNRVPNGLLLDYAMEFADLKSYTGTLTDSNKNLI